MSILVTGSAGFIGHHVVLRLLEHGHDVVGIDSINDYYDVNLKYARLAEQGFKRDSIRPGKMVTSRKFPQHRFFQLALEDRKGLAELFETESFDRVCHLAAQAGVRNSLSNPHSYIESNCVGFLGVLEGCRTTGVRHLVYASSSSVYGLNESMPFSTSHSVSHPASLYAATKKSNELMAHAYSHTFQLPTTGLRFFTVYGPWGRPDMALFLFTKAILESEPIDIYNNGKMARDFTYVDDVVEGLLRVLDRIPEGNPSWSARTADPSDSRAPYRIFNVGSSSPVRLLDFVQIIEECTRRTAKKRYLPMQLGDVERTWADVEDLERDTGFRPRTPIREGVAKFVEWYLSYYGVPPLRKHRTTPRMDVPSAYGSLLPREIPTAL